MELPLTFISMDSFNVRSFLPPHYGPSPKKTPRVSGRSFPPVNPAVKHSKLGVEVDVGQ